MGVSVLNDKLVAQLALAQTKELLMEKNPDFKQMAHATYLQLTNIIRKSHEHAYPDRYHEERAPAETYSVDDFDPQESAFTTAETLEGEGHLYNVVSYYLEMVQGETSQFNEQMVVVRLEEMMDDLMSRMIERKQGVPTRRMDLALPVDDALKRDRVSNEISALASASPMLFEMESGLKTVTSRLLIESRQGNITFMGPETLRGIILQGGRAPSEQAPYFIPRVYPNFDDTLDADVKHLFAQVAEKGNREVIPKDELGQSLTHVAALAEAMLSKLSLTPPEQLRGLDNIPYSQDDKKALVDGFRQATRSLQVAATLPDRKLSGSQPFEEAKATFDAYHKPSRDVYIFSRTPQTMINEGESRSAYIQEIRSYLQNNPVTATTNKLAADDLMSKYGGTIVGVKVAPNEIGRLGPVCRGINSYTSSVISQMVRDIDVKTLHAEQNFGGVLEKLGIPSTPGIEAAMKEGMSNLDGYDLQTPFDASTKLAFYVSAKLPPAARDEWENTMKGIEGRGCKI